MGQTITVNTILSEISKYDLDVSGQAVVSAGALNLARVAKSPTDLSILRLVWNTAVSRTMILSVALVAASIPFTLGMEWLNAKKVAEARKHAKEFEKDTTKAEP